MVVRGNHITLVFFISTILAAASLWPSITNGETTFPLDKQDEMQAHADLIARNKTLVTNFVEQISARSKGDRALLPFVQSLNNISLTITAHKQPAISLQDERVTKWLNQTPNALDDGSELNAATLRAAPSFSFSPTFVNSEIDQTLAEN